MAEVAYPPIRSACCSLDCNQELQHQQCASLSACATARVMSVPLQHTRSSSRSPGRDAAWLQKQRLRRSAARVKADWAASAKPTWAELPNLQTYSSEHHRGGLRVVQCPIDGAFEDDPLAGAKLLLMGGEAAAAGEL